MKSFPSSPFYSCLTLYIPWFNFCTPWSKEIKKVQQPNLLFHASSKYKVVEVLIRREIIKN